MKVYKYKKIIFSTLFVLTTNFCFARTARSIDDYSLKDLILILLFMLAIAAVPLYFLVYLPYIKRKKMQEFCKKNNLTYISKSEELPDNIKYNFIKINAGQNGRCTYTNIMQGTKNDISFILCEYYFKYTKGNTTIESPLFPLLIIKKDNINFPNFFLRNENDLDGYRKIGSIAMSGGFVVKGKTEMRKDEEKLILYYKNLIRFYQNKLLNIKEDQKFNKKFSVDVDDEEVSKRFFDDNVRQFFYEKSKPQQVYEGNGSLFIISSSHTFITFEETIKFFEDGLKFYVELASV